jgi:hypothetical protein
MCFFGTFDFVPSPVKVLLKDRELDPGLVMLGDLEEERCLAFGFLIVWTSLSDFFIPFVSMSFNSPVLVLSMFRNANFSMFSFFSEF